MRTVTSRSELIAGIKAGERRFKVEGKSLLLQCAIASKFNSVGNVTDAAVASVVPAAGANVAITGPVLLGLTAIAVVGAIAIIAILKDKHLKIKVFNSDGKGGEIEVF